MELVQNEARLIRRAYGRELRIAGRTVSGIAAPYGDRADRGAFIETFEPGAFPEADRADVVANIMHREDRVIGRTDGGGLVLRDTPEGLLAAVTLDTTRDGDDALKQVRSGVLRGWSVEMRVVRARMDGALRRVQRAALVGLGLVDRPAYPLAEGLEVRVAGRTISGVIATGRRLGCKCQGPTCNAVEFDADAFEVNDSVLAVNGGYGAPLASAKRGTVRHRMTAAGLAVEIDVPDGEVGEQLIELADAVPLFIRPFLDREASEYEQTGDLRKYTKARVRAFIVGATDADEGMPEATVGRRENRRQLWPSL